MTPYWTKTHLFIKGAARNKDLIYFSVHQKDLEEEDIQHSIFIAWYRGKWFQEAHMNWNCMGMSVVKNPIEKLISISEEGEIWTYVGGASTTEKISPMPASIRNISTINGYAYACGMDRQVFKRINEGQWESMHANFPSKDINKGFEDIDGFSESEIYAVGWSGEIWKYDGIDWDQKDSPTNLILTCLSCAENGNVYVGGRQGTIIQGINNQWNLLGTDDFAKDIWDITYFDGKVYLATMNGVFHLDDNGISSVGFGDDFPTTCYKLTQAEGVLWSIGSSDVFSFDGNTWTRIE